MKNYMDVREVSEGIGVSTSSAYKIIRKLNDELREKGYLTVAGKVPAKYFQERWYGFEKEGGKHESTKRS